MDIWVSPCSLVPSLHTTHSSLVQAITTPAMAVSHIMLESYKKYILVSLILLGKVQQLPKYTSQIVGRFIKVSLQIKVIFLHSVLICL